MSNLEWFERVYTNLEDKLHDACELMEELIESGYLSISSSEGEKHPSIHVEYSIPDLDFEEVITIYFDPYNQEFYFLEEDDELEVRVMLKSLDDIVGYIHHTIHDSVSHEVAAEDDEFPFFKTDSEPDTPKSLSEDFAPQNINWLTKEVATTENSFDVPFKHSTVVSYRLGMMESQFILVRFDTVYVDGKKVSKQGAIFPFEKGDELVIQNLLNTSLYKG